MIPILNIENFNPPIEIENYFYSNHLDIHLKKNEQHFNQPHRHSFYLCVLIIEGEGRHEIDFTSYDVKPGRVFFLKPGQSHFWDFTSSVKGYIFFHTLEFFRLSMNELNLNEFPFYTLNEPFLDLPKGKIQFFTQSFENINNEYNNDQVFKRAYLLSLVNVIYIDFLRLFDQKSKPLPKQSINNLILVHKLESLITSHFKQNKKAAFYAEQLHVSVRHLNRISKEVLNKTLTEILHDKIILEAKRLLVHTKQRLTTIAIELGFEDYSHFSKFFKLKTGESPSSFRKRY